MRFCPQCGKQIDDHSAFCTHCGAKTAGQPAAQSPGTPRMRLHCPRCKSTRLSAMSESIGSIGGARGVGKRSAIGMSTTLRQRSWTCHDCGHVFRNVDDLAAEYAQQMRVLNTVVIIFGVFIVLIAFLGALSTGDFGAFLGFIPAFAVFGVLYYFLQKMGKQIRAKKVEELRKACFD